MLSKKHLGCLLCQKVSIVQFLTGRGPCFHFSDSIHLHKELGKVRRALDIYLFQIFCHLIMTNIDHKVVPHFSFAGKF